MHQLEFALVIEGYDLALAVEMRCPICLDKFNDSVIFSCTHGCCRRCFQVSEITKCPICRGPVSTVTPAPWLDTMSQLEDTQDYNEDYDEDQDTDEEFDLEAHQEYQKYQSEYQDNQQYEPYERHEKSRPVVDNRGYKLIQISNQIMASANTIFSKSDFILAYHETKVSAVEKKYQLQLDEFMKKLVENKEKDLLDLQAETQKSLDKDANVVKIQEYRNQSLEHLAQTCRSLSTQTTEVLDQALPVYRDKINRVMLEGKLNKILSIVSPKSCFEFGFLHKQEIIKPLIVYVEKANDFAYVHDETLFFGSHEIRLQFEDSDIKILKTYNDLIYLMIGNEVTVYDTELDIVFTADSDTKLKNTKMPVNFYVSQGLVNFVYQNLRGPVWETYVYFGKVPYVFGHSFKPTMVVEVVGDQLAIMMRELTIKMDGINNHPKSTFINSDDAVVISGHIYTCEHTPDGTEIKTPNGKVLYHGHGSLYSGPSGSAFYVQDSNAILVDFA